MQQTPLGVRVDALHRLIGGHQSVGLFVRAVSAYVCALFHLWCIYFIVARVSGQTLLWLSCLPISQAQLPPSCDIGHIAKGMWSEPYQPGQLICSRTSPSLASGSCQVTSSPPCEGLKGALPLKLLAYLDGRLATPPVAAG